VRAQLRREDRAACGASWQVEAAEGAEAKSNGKSCGAGQGNDPLSIRINVFTPARTGVLISWAASGRLLRGCLMGKQRGAATLH
jgi:hypothetical protein